MAMTKAAAGRAHQGLYREAAARDEARHLADLEQVRATTGVVIFAVFAFAAYFFVVDTVVNAGIDRVIQLFHACVNQVDGRRT